MAEMNPGQTWECEQKLPLPIGVSNYCLAASEYYYIDKTMMIKDFIDERPMVTLFTRPRRFGKTLNMDMLRTYFERSDKDTSVYFRDKKIWSCGQKYRDYQGRYPVIFLTFKDVKFDTWEETFAALRDIFAKEAQRHKELQSSEKCDGYSRKVYERLVNGSATEVELSSALLDLSAMLHSHYDVAPVIIIDEYDTPIQQGHSEDYYDKIIRFMRNLFSGGFKDHRPGIENFCLSKEIAIIPLTYFVVFISRVIICCHLPDLVCRKSEVSAVFVVQHRINRQVVHSTKNTFFGYPQNAGEEPK